MAINRFSESIGSGMDALYQALLTGRGWASSFKCQACYKLSFAQNENSSASLTAAEIFKSYNEAK